MEQENASKGVNTPEQKFRAGGVVATIWSNTGQNKEGGQTAYKTVSLDRTYKDKDGEWKHSNSMRLNDLPKVEVVIRKAYEFLVLKGEANASVEPVEVM